jgi:hypothetical protein
MPGMIVWPARSTCRAPAGIGTAARGPTARIRLPSTMITPSSITPPSAPAMVMIRAPTKAVTPSGRSAVAVTASETPDCGVL